MSQVQARTLKGFRDYLPEDDIPRQRMLRRVAEVFESFGFGPLTTPALEYQDVLLGKYGEEGDKLLYRFVDNGEREVALRYDLTVPLARVIGQHRHLPLPFRRYQVAPVWRAEKPAKGRFREFLQCDIDIVGEPSVRADAECLMVGLEVLRALEVPKFVMRVNNRRVLDGLLDTVGVEGKALRHGVLRAVDKLPKQGPDAVRAELREQVGLDDAGVDAVFDFMARRPKSIEDVEALRDVFPESEIGGRGVDELKTLLELAAAAGYADEVEVDLSIARGLDYYNGTIYETFVVGHESYGSVMSGGRYDDLIGMFLKESVPAVGLSLGVDRLLSLLVDIGVTDKRPSVSEVYVALFDDEGFGDMAAVARDLRAAGLKVEMALSAKKLGKQFKAAEKQGCRWVVLAGKDERRAGQIAIKDLSSGEQRTVPRGDAAAFIANATRPGT